jgi:hypothetical protein
VLVSIRETLKNALGISLYLQTTLDYEASFTDQLARHSPQNVRISSGEQKTLSSCFLRNKKLSNPLITMTDERWGVDRESSRVTHDVVMFWITLAMTEMASSESPVNVNGPDDSTI